MLTGLVVFAKLMVFNCTETRKLEDTSLGCRNGDVSGSRLPFSSMCGELLNQTVAWPMKGGSTIISSVMKPADLHFANCEIARVAAVVVSHCDGRQLLPNIAYQMKCS